MLYLKLLRFIGGWDTVKLAPCPEATDQGSGETVLDLLRQFRIPYEKVRRDEDGSISLTTARGNRSKIISLLDKNEIKVYSIYGHGVPALFDRYRRRPGIAVGALVLAAALSLSTRFIWNIEICGEEAVMEQEDEILERLSSLGCEVGSFIPGIDFYSLCTKYLAASDDTAWISVNIIGTKAEVHVQRRLEQEGRVDEDRPSNVVASEDGVIEYVNTYSGASVVHDGDTVIRGQLLISGVVEDKNDLSNRFLHADGVVMAKTYHELTVSVPLRYDEKVYDGKALKRTELGVFGYKMTLRSPQVNDGTLYEEESERHKVCVMGDIELPITVWNTSYHSYSLREVERSEAEAEALADAEMAALIAGELDGAEILSRETEARIDVDADGNDVYILCCKIRCIEDIAQTVPITLAD